MFTFVSFDDQPDFIQTPQGKVYTYPSEAEALTYFGCIRHRAHLYRVEPDLSLATLMEVGDGESPPMTFVPTEEQKESLYESYVYKSLLFWKPIPRTLSA